MSRYTYTQVPGWSKVSNVDYNLPRLECRPVDGLVVWINVHLSIGGLSTTFECSFKHYIPRGPRVVVIVDRHPGQIDIYYLWVVYLCDYDTRNGTALSKH